MVFETFLKEVHVTKFLQDLMAEMKNVSLGDAKGPTEPSGNGEVDICVMDESHRRLYCVMIKYIDQVKDLADRHNAHFNTEGNLIDGVPLNVLKQLNSEYERLSDIATLLSKMFWRSVRTEFPETENYTDLVLRQGWRVVAFNNRSKPTLFDLLLGELD